MPYITPDGNYTETVYVAEGSISVPVRPSENHKWDGSAWVENFDKLKAALLAKFRADRMQMFFVVASMISEAEINGDQPAVLALHTFRAGLKDLPAWPAVVAATSAAALASAMSTRYKTLTAGLPSAQKTYFKKLMG